MIKQAAILQHGLIYKGHRHRDIYAKHKNLNRKECEEGFVTNAGMFVDRKTAAQIAFTTGQIKRNKQKLVSEDIY